MEGVPSGSRCGAHSRIVCDVRITTYLLSSWPSPRRKHSSFYVQHQLSPRQVQIRVNKRDGVRGHIETSLKREAEHLVRGRSGKPVAPNDTQIVVWERGGTGQ